MILMLLLALGLIYWHYYSSRKRLRATALLLPQSNSKLESAKYGALPLMPGSHKSSEEEMYDALPPSDSEEEMHDALPPSDSEEEMHDALPPSPGSASQDSDDSWSDAQPPKVWWAKLPPPSRPPSAPKKTKTLTEQLVDAASSSMQLFRTRKDVIGQRQDNARWHLRKLFGGGKKLTQTEFDYLKNDSKFLTYLLNGKTDKYHKKARRAYEAAAYST